MPKVRLVASMTRRTTRSGLDSSMVASIAPSTDTATHTAPAGLLAQVRRCTGLPATVIDSSTTPLSRFSVRPAYSPSSRPPSDIHRSASGRNSWLYGPSKLISSDSARR